MKHFLTLALALAALLTMTTVLSGCASEKAPDGLGNVDDGLENPSDGSSSSGTDAEIPALPDVVYKDSDKNVVMTIGGKDISESMLRYYVLNNKDAYGGDNADLWVTSAVEQIKNDVAIGLSAADNHVTLDAETKKAGVDDVVAQTISYYNSQTGTSYETELERYYMTDALFRELQESMVLQSELYSECFAEGGSQYTVTDEEIADYIKNNYVRVKHILIKTIDLDDEQKAEARARADKVLSEAKNGTSFEDLVTEYSEDGMDVDTGYYFTYGEMVPEFEEASFALEVGEISDLVESTYGYHIIKRYEMDNDYILTDETLHNNAASEITIDNFVDDLNTRAAALTVEYTDQYEPALTAMLGSDANAGE